MRMSVYYNLVNGTCYTQVMGISPEEKYETIKLIQERIDSNEWFQVDKNYGGHARFRGDKVISFEWKVER